MTIYSPLYAFICPTPTVPPLTRRLQTIWTGRMCTWFPATTPNTPPWMNARPPVKPRWLDATPSITLSAYLWGVGITCRLLKLFVRLARWCMHLCLRCVDWLHFSRKSGGKCQFQQCNGRLIGGAVRDFDSYILMDPRPVTWRQVGTHHDLHLDCTKLNQGWSINHCVQLMMMKRSVEWPIPFFLSPETALPTSPAAAYRRDMTGSKDGPRYDSKYPTVDECKAACENEVPKCDAINYSE